ncbi:MAG: hypothetical protein AAF333_09295 [Planctomycetota bacterium]
MDNIPPDLKQLIERTESSWQMIYDALETDPAPAEEYLQGVDHRAVGEAILTILLWMRDLFPPKKKRSKTYQLARATLIMSAEQLAQRLSRISAGDYQSLQGLTTDLARVLNALVVTTKASKDIRDDLVSSQVSAITNAAGELEQARVEIDSARETLDQIHSLRDSLSAIADNGKSIFEQIEVHRADALNELEEIQSISPQTQEANQAAIASMKKIGVMEEKAEGVCKTIDTQENRLGKLIYETQEIRDQINTLLPGATSAGLATAFQSRAEKVDKSIKFWAIGFGFGIFVLTAGIIGGYYLISPSGSSLSLADFVRRIPLVAPGIWIAWFCARGHTRVSKLRETYAFKQAMSQAFEGYKNQMLELDRSKATGELAKQLSEAALTTLAMDPVRVFDSSERDSNAPAESILKKLVPKRYTNTNNTDPKINGD